MIMYMKKSLKKQLAFSGSSFEILVTGSVCIANYFRNALCLLDLDGWVYRFVAYHVAAS